MSEKKIFTKFSSRKASWIEGAFEKAKLDDEGTVDALTTRKACSINCYSSPYAGGVERTNVATFYKTIEKRGEKVENWEILKNEAP